MNSKTKEEYLKMHNYLYKQSNGLDFNVKTTMLTIVKRRYISRAKKGTSLYITQEYGSRNCLEASFTLFFTDGTQVTTVSSEEKSFVRNT